MPPMNKVLEDKIQAGHDQQVELQKAIHPCNIFSINTRTRQLVLQDPISGTLLQIPTHLPHQDIWRIPTPDSNFVMLLTLGGRRLGGVPILYDRTYIEPKIFETVDPAGEQA